MMHRPTRLRREQGMALIAVMLLLMAMSALAAALAISSTTETMIARNHQSAAQARAAAEAGLTHAVDLTLDFLSSWQGSYASAGPALSALLADPTLAGLEELDNYVLAGTGTTFSSIAYSGGSFTSIQYEAVLLDDDDATGRDLLLSADDLTRMGEDGDPDVDTNTKLVLRAIGYAGGNAVAAVEATIAAIDLPAILVEGDLEFAGNFDLSGDGSHGNAHTNGNFTHSGGAWSAEDGCTSSGTSDDGDCAAGATDIEVPDKTASDYESLANYILHDDGEMTTVSTGVKASCSPCAGGWTYASGTWTLGSALTSAANASAFYVEGDVALGESNTVTVIATGSISAGNGTWLSSVGNILIVVDGDLRDTGNPNFGSDANEGLILIGEQIYFGGNVEIHGQIIVRDASTLSNVVTENKITGSVTVEYNGGADGQFFAVSAWRRSY